MFCMFGWHNWIIVNEVSLLHYMHLAFGATIAELETPVLIELMRQLLLELPDSAIIYDAKNIDRALGTFSEDDKIHMGGHLEALAASNKSYVDAERELPELRRQQEDDYHHRQKEYVPKIEACQKRLAQEERLLVVASAYLSLKFCTKCHVSYDPRDKLGEFLPKIKNKLDASKLNETNGYFLLPKKQD